MTASSSAPRSHIAEIPKLKSNKLAFYHSFHINCNLFNIHIWVLTNLRYRYYPYSQFNYDTFIPLLRSVLCNDPDMYDIPVNVPVDTVKLRVEKTVIRRIPTEAFYYLVDLKYLWVTYNSITSIDSSSFYNLKQLHELRLDGNMISVFPWESLLEMPRLRTLDLHNNKIASIPVEAARYLKNITYLDVSSNKLTTMPSDFLEIWPPLSEPVSRSTDLYYQRVILGKLC